MDANPPTDENAMDFGYALDQLKGGKAVYRSGWNGPGQYIQLQKPDDSSKMTLPYLYIFTTQGGLVPWLASQTDLLAEDWHVINNEEQEKTE